ncbi:hypothetical protein EVAR_92627_1 [Eumeta japonica]|uniref:Uncharacterized protein n=1 Tax=Eumeta variegata TaxID=151549 RepID=A0A4C1SZI6_EUMVA|nr:hypothetical protein EVAR_92627_1 [Eumeta japonica]
MSGRADVSIVTGARAAGGGGQSLEPPGKSTVINCQSCPSALWPSPPNFFNSGSDTDSNPNPTLGFDPRFRPRIEIHPISVPDLALLTPLFIPIALTALVRSKD